MIFLLLCLLMLWLVFLPQTECKIHPILCNKIDALQIPHEYYQPGNFIIGGISSQFVSFFKALSFQEHPRSMFIEDPIMPSITNFLEIHDSYMKIEKRLNFFRINEVKAVLTPPFSVCNDHCHPGSVRRKKDGKPFCCYDCVSCPKGKISNQNDLDNCIQCPDDQYANTNQDECLPK
ncbi:hypothetical protein E2320_002972, partial [Naja naja]